ncbi:hypothetical protein C8F04DRAFT_1405097 [Mycena alexandri]|uniref:DUF6533 domain-containing protein n=1 Tax=Mycena alexandri TaxID=1745969 RepID=A0AAD6S3C8_9AGAR|nr:hypothetical protein C8F04DRAFT_1405097 [Mycena alexandri]
MASFSSSSEINLGGLDYTTFAYDHRIYRELFLSGFVILVYDHILTLSWEVKFIWNKKFHFGAYWFLAIRYISLGCNITITLFYFGNLSIKSCSKMERVLEALQALQIVFVDTTFGLRVLAMTRVLAIYGLSPWVGLPIAIVNIVTAGLGLWTMIEYGAPQMLAAPGMSGCHTSIPRSTGYRFAGVWESQVVLDTLVFGLTLYRAYADRSTASVIPRSLVQCMMLDGTMYFGIIVVAHVGDVLTIYLGDEIISGILSWWTTSLSVTLISRLNLNLHRVASRNLGTLHDDGGTELDKIDFVTPNARSVMQVAGDVGSQFDDV